MAQVQVLPLGTSDEHGVAQTLVWLVNLKQSEIIKRNFAYFQGECPDTFQTCVLVYVCVNGGVDWGVDLASPAWIGCSGSSDAWLPEPQPLVCAEFQTSRAKQTGPLFASPQIR